MSDPRFVLLYVQQPLASARFYAELLGRPPLESSPTFAMFGLDGGWKLGLWAAHAVQPPATLAGGGELAFPVEHAEQVHVLHASWRAQGMSIEQPPTSMDFGVTFVARDPDGHRLRVFAPGAA